MFQIPQNCKSVLLSDNAGYNGLFTITAVPLRDATTNQISIDSVLINFGSTSYLVDETGVKVKLHSI